MPYAKSARSIGRRAEHRAQNLWYGNSQAPHRGSWNCESTDHGHVHAEHVVDARGPVGRAPEVGPRPSRDRLPSPGDGASILSSPGDMPERQAGRTGCTPIRIFSKAEISSYRRRRLHAHGQTYERARSPVVPSERHRWTFGRTCCRTILNAIANRASEASPASRACSRRWAGRRHQANCEGPFRFLHPNNGILWWGDTGVEKLLGWACGVLAGAFSQGGGVARLALGRDGWSDGDPGPPTAGALTGGALWRTDTMAPTKPQGA